MPNSDKSVSTEDVTFQLYLTDSDIFDEVSVTTTYQNQRKTVRYVRRDISAFISQADIFGTYRLFSHSRAIRVKLLDVSSRGVLIAVPSTCSLKLNKKIMLTLIFNTNRKFDIAAKVVRELVKGRRFYGVKFDKANDALGDYLLESQSSLVFK